MIIRTDTEWISVANEVHKLQVKRKKIEEQEKKALEQLKLLSDEKTCFGDKYLFSKESRKGSIEYKAIPVLKGVDLEPYRKDDVVYFKFSVLEDADIHFV